jgi:hypothetical protein
MPLKIITADERLAAPPKTNIAVFGPSGIGKTTLARTLDPKTTLFVDMEAGTLALSDWGGDVLDIRAQATQLGVHPWQLERAIACVMCGPDPAADPADLGNPYSKANYDIYCDVLGGADAFARYTTVFWDSITVASRHAFSWAQGQPEAFSEKTGKPDTRGAYGLLGREMVRWLTTIQHIKDKSTVVVGLLNEETDDLRRVTYSLQIEGGKAKNELAGIFDSVFTLTSFKTEEGEPYRALVCQQLNQWGYPAKDRSGRLDVVERPDLAFVINKGRSAQRGDLVTQMPSATSKAAA